MTDHDDVLKELRAALQVEPSRDFASGVRARVRKSKARTNLAWWSLAAAACVGLATAALWRPTIQTSAPTVATTQPTLVPSNSATMASDARSVPVLGGSAVARTPVARTAAASEPRLEVITNQAAVLRQLWAGVNPAALVETIAEGAVPVPVAEVKPIAPIVLDPIVVTPILVTEIGKDSGAAGATPVIRRVDATKETR